MPGVVKSSFIPYIGCMTLLVALVLQVLSYAAPFWAYDSKGDFGLWRHFRCISVDENGPRPDMGCYKQDQPWYAPDWLKAVQAMESLAIIFWAIPLLVIPVYMYVSLGLYYRCMMGTMTAFTLLAAICNLIGFLIYASKIAQNSTWSTGWCFILCVISCGFGLVSFVILLVATCSRPKFTLDDYYDDPGYYIHPQLNDMYVIENGEPYKDASLFNGGGQVNPVVIE